MCGVFGDGDANGNRENLRFTGLRSIKHLTEKSNKSRRVTGSRRMDRRVSVRQDKRGGKATVEAVHASKMSADTSWRARV